VRVVSRERVETTRMICERLRPEHRDELLGLVLDPRVARWIEADGRRAPEDEVTAWLEAKYAYWERYGFGQWWPSARQSDARSQVLIGRMARDPVARLRKVRDSNRERC
jgi:hypothetical protein